MVCRRGGGSIRPQKATSIPVTDSVLHRLWRSVGHSSDFENATYVIRPCCTQWSEDVSSFLLGEDSSAHQLLPSLRGHLPAAVQQVRSTCCTGHAWQV